MIHQKSGSSENVVVYVLSGEIRQNEVIQYSDSWILNSDFFVLIYPAHDAHAEYIHNNRNRIKNTD